MINKTQVLKYLQTVTIIDKYNLEGGQDKIGDKQPVYIAVHDEGLLNGVINSK